MPKLAKGASLKAKAPPKAPREQLAPEAGPEEMQDADSNSEAPPPPLAEVQRTAPLAAAAKCVGRLSLGRVLGRTEATNSYAAYPLKFMIPARAGLRAMDRPPKRAKGDHGQAPGDGAADGAADYVGIDDCVVAFIVTYGGGIVSGDSIGMVVDVAAGCTGVLTTQASTKVFKALQPHLLSAQSMAVKVSAGALLAVLPDPVTCFRKSRYSQRQEFDLDPEGSVLVVDWVTAGRTRQAPARTWPRPKGDADPVDRGGGGEGEGEHWDFDLYESVTEIRVSGEPLLVDATRLDGPEAAAGGGGIHGRMCGVGVVALVTLIGPRMVPHARRLEEALKSHARRSMVARQGNGTFSSSGIKVSLSPLSYPEGCGPATAAVGDGEGSLLDGGAGRYAGLAIRVCGAGSEDVYGFLREHLAATEGQLGGWTPYHSNAC